MQSREIVQDSNFTSSSLREINISKQAFADGANEVKVGLNKMMGSMEVIKGKDGGIPSNGNALRGPYGIENGGVTTWPEAGYN